MTSDALEPHVDAGMWWVTRNRPSWANPRLEAWCAGVAWQAKQSATRIAELEEALQDVRDGRDGWRDVYKDSRAKHEASQAKLAKVQAHAEALIAENDNAGPTYAEGFLAILNGEK